jgi:hypothetical protein
METYNFAANVLGNYTKIFVNLTLISFKEDEIFIIYSPALELYGYGETISEAKNSFNTCLEEFIDYTLAKKTFESELKRLGWKIKGTHKNRKYKVPDFSDFLKNNQRLIDILNEKEVQTYKEDIPMAIPV